MSKPEVIKHAAVRNSAGQFMIGKSHAECFWKAARTGFDLSQRADDQGFLSSHGRFLTRPEAAKIAVDSGQVDKTIKILFSEELWSKVHNGRFDYCEILGYYLRDKVRPQKLRLDKWFLILEGPEYTEGFAYKDPCAELHDKQIEVVRRSSYERVSEERDDLLAWFHQINKTLPSLQKEMESISTAWSWVGETVSKAVNGEKVGP